MANNVLLRHVPKCISIVFSKNRRNLWFCRMDNRSIDKNILKDDSSGVGNSSTSKYEVSLVLCELLCLSLRVLVSIFWFLQKANKNEKSSPLHTKLTHENEHNTKETLCLDVEEFPTPHALSLYIFYLWMNWKLAL
jgi:hypothetical protein